MSTHKVELTLLQRQLDFFAGLFIGQTLSEENTEEEKNIAMDNYNAIKKFLNDQQKKDVAEATRHLADANTMKTLKAKTKDFIKEVQTMID